MKKWKKWFRYLSRIDVFNRMLVFISMALFLFYPSMVLYETTPTNETFSSVMPSVFIIGLTIGNGLLALVRPNKSTWLYFLIDMIAFPFIFMNYDVSYLNLRINPNVVFLVSFLFCFLSFGINSFYLLYVMRRKTKSEWNEKTNNDTIYDFLGGVKKNEKISKRLDEAIQKNGGTFEVNGLKHVKLSRMTRIVSFIFTYIICIIYFFKLNGFSSLYNNQMAVVLLISILVLPLCLFMSILYPYDYKYMYYFNVLFFLLCAIIDSRFYHLKAFFFILSIILSGLSLLITLIVEGRTWTGAKPD